MDLNIRLKVESPELMASILALAEALPKVQLGEVLSLKKVQAIEAKETVIKTENKNEDPAKEELKAIALEEVRSKLTSLAQSGKQSEVKALIKSFGVAKLTDIPKEKYHELLKAAEEI